MLLVAPLSRAVETRHRHRASGTSLEKRRLHTRPRVWSKHRLRDKGGAASNRLSGIYFRSDCRSSISSFDVAAQAASFSVSLYPFLSRALAIVR